MGGIQRSSGWGGGAGRSVMGYTAQGIETLTFCSPTVPDLLVQYQLIISHDLPAAGNTSYSMV